MSFDSLEDRDLEKWIAQSLHCIREAAFDGLDEQDALRRAQRLNALIVEGRILPAEVEPDDLFKDVLYALVYRLLGTEDGALGETTRHAMAIYDFIHGIPWDKDDLDEKLELLNHCAAAGAGHGAGHRFAIGPRGEAVPIDSRNSPSKGDAEPKEPSRQTEIGRICDSGLPVVHAILVELYQLSDLDARGLERELVAWFTRFRRRVGNTKSRVVLLAAASEMARQYRRFEEGPLELPGAAEARLGKVLFRALRTAEREWALEETKRSGG
jgi:hypothetical protein